MIIDPSLVAKTQILLIVKTFLLNHIKCQANFVASQDLTEHL